MDSCKCWWYVGLLFLMLFSATMLTLAVPKYLVIRRGGPFVGTQLSKGGAAGREGAGGKGDGSDDFNSVMSGTGTGAGLMGAAGTGGTTTSGARINPTHFAKTCEVIRNRLRGSTQERNQDLAPFIEHAQRFVEQLQAMRGSVSSPSGAFGQPGYSNRMSGGNSGGGVGERTSTLGGGRPPNLQQVSRPINLGPARTGLTSEHRIDGEGGAGAGGGGDVASSPLSPTPVELNSVHGGVISGGIGGQRHAAASSSSRVSQSQREGGLHGRHSLSPPPPPLTQNPALALLPGVNSSGEGAHQPRSSRSSSPEPPPPIPSSMSVGPRYDPHANTHVYEY